MSPYLDTWKLLATDLVVLNHGQVMSTTPELEPTSPNFHTTPTKGHLSLDIFTVYRTSLHGGSSVVHDSFFLLIIFVQIVKKEKRPFAPATGVEMGRRVHLGTGSLQRDHFDHLRQREKRISRVNSRALSPDIASVFENGPDFGRKHTSHECNLDH
ncbi:hypothetical protein TNCV_2126901 [Trichonephila clavipes]|nr:hypothetical protein TNCV_2126901 [Trichonephila clavipes]